MSTTVMAKSFKPTAVVDPEVVLTEVSFAYGEREVALYALGARACCANAVDEELHFVYHRDGQPHIKNYQACQFSATPQEALTMAQDVVKTRQELLMSKRIGLTDRVSAGVGAIQSVDETFHVSETTKDGC